MDARAGWEKARQHQLADPHQFFDYAVRSGVRAGAHRIQVGFGVGLFLPAVTSLEHDGALPSRDELEHLYRHLLGASGTEGLQDLAVAANSSLRLKQARVAVLTWDGRQGWRLDLRSDGQSLEEHVPRSRRKAPWLRLVVQRRLTMRDLGLFPLESYCLGRLAHAPVPILRGYDPVNELRFQRPPEDMSLRLDYGQGRRHEHRCEIRVVAPRPGPDSFAILPWTTAIHQERIVCGLDGEPDPSARPEPVRIPFRGEHFHVGDRSSDLCLAAVARLKGAARKASILWILHGVHLGWQPVTAWPRDTVAFASASGLTLDLAGQIVDDARLRRRMEWLGSLVGRLR